MTLPTRRLPTFILMTLACSSSACREVEPVRLEDTGSRAAGGTPGAQGDGGTGGSSGIPAGGRDAGATGGSANVQDAQTEGGDARAEGSPADAAVEAGHDAVVAPEDSASDASAPVEFPDALGAIDPIVAPPCMTVGGSHPQVGVVGPFGDVAAATTLGRGQYALIAPLPRSHLFTLTWERTEVDPTWLPWYCFDVVVNPLRAAAVNLGSGALDVYATATGGRLLHRRQFSEGRIWGNWMPLTPPQKSADLQDVAASPGPGDSVWLFVVSDGYVFGKEGSGPEGAATFGRWQSLGGGFARRIASEDIGQNRQRIWTAGSEGELAMTEFEAAPEVRREAWTTIVAPEEVTDLAASAGPAKSDGGLLRRHLFVLGRSGNLWMTSDDSPPGAAWSQLTPTGSAAPLVSLAAATQVGQEPLLAAVNADGVLGTLRWPYTVWTPVR